MRSFGILIISSLCSFYFYWSTVSGESMVQFPDIERFTIEFRKKNIQSSYNRQTGERKIPLKAYELSK